MNKQSVSEIIDSWETHGLQNLHEISLDRIYAFPLTRMISTYEKVVFSGTWIIMASLDRSWLKPRMNKLKI